MKIGLLTNLFNIEKFVSKDLINANAEDWMQATGGNTGNVAFVHGIQHLLGDTFKVIHWGDNPKLVKQTFDHIVVCCANQIGTHISLDGWHRRFMEFDLPVTFIGLGAQSDRIGQIPDVPEGTKKLLSICEHLRVDKTVNNIITRGEFSSSVLKHYGADSLPYGCPSQFISLGKELGTKCLNHQHRAQFDRVLTAAGNPWHPSYVIENTLTEISERYRGDYVLQHPKCLIELALGETQNIPESTINVIERAYSRIGNWEKIKAWFESYSVFFADALNWMHYSRHFTLAIGPRYHGVALPIQAGVPGKVISIDSRTEELATTTGVPTVRYDQIKGMSADDLVKFCRWNESDASNYDEIRKTNAKNYLNFFESNKLPVNAKLRELANS